MTFSALSAALPSIKTGVNGCVQANIVNNFQSSQEDHEHGKTYLNMAIAQLSQASFCLYNTFSAVNSFSKFHNFTPPLTGFTGEAVKLLISGGFFTLIGLSAATADNKYTEVAKYANEKASALSNKLFNKNIKILPDNAGPTGNKIAFFVTKHIGHVSEAFYIVAACLRYYSGGQVEAIASLTIIGLGVLDRGSVFNKIDLRISIFLERHFTKIVTVGGLVLGGPLTKVISTVQLVYMLSGFFSKQLSYKIDEKILEKATQLTEDIASYPTLRQIEQDPNFIFIENDIRAKAGKLFIKPHHLTFKGNSLFNTAQVQKVQVNSLNTMYQQIDWNNEIICNTMMTRLKDDDRFKSYLKKEEIEYKTLSDDVKRKLCIDWSTEQMNLFVQNITGRKRATGSAEAIPALQKNVKEVIYFLEKFRRIAESDADPIYYGDYCGYLMTYAIRGGDYCVSGLSAAVEINAKRLINDKNVAIALVDPSQAKAKFAKENVEDENMALFEGRIYGNLQEARMLFLEGIYDMLQKTVGNNQAANLLTSMASSTAKTGVDQLSSTLLGSSATPGAAPSFFSKMTTKALDGLISLSALTHKIKGKNALKNDVHDFNDFVNNICMGIGVSTLGSEYESSNTNAYINGFKNPLIPFIRTSFWNPGPVGQEMLANRYTSARIQHRIMDMFKSKQLKMNSFTLWLKAKIESNSAKLGFDKDKAIDRLYTESAMLDGRNRNCLPTPLYLKYMLCEMGILGDLTGKIRAYVHATSDIIDHAHKTLPQEPRNNEVINKLVDEGAKLLNENGEQMGKILEAFRNGEQVTPDMLQKVDRRMRNVIQNFAPSNSQGLFPGSSQFGLDAGSFSF